MKDLTKGYPAKVILMFAIPLMCSSILQQLYNMVDSKIVSAYVGTAAFAAVGATSVVSNTLIGFINGLTQGFAILVANSFGAKDEKRMRQSVAGTLILTTVITVILTVLGLLLIRPILTMLRTPDDIMDNALSYVRIILAGIAFTALYNVFANILRAVGDSKTPLYCLTFAVILNVGLDLLFVAVFKWGIQGAAYATVLAQAISGFLCMAYVLSRFRDLLPHRLEWSISGELYSNLTTTGLAMGLMGCIVNIGTIILQSAINGLGTSIVAAHTAARRLFDILMILIYTVGLAMTTYVSQNAGAGRVDRIKQGVRHAHVVATIISTMMILLCYLIARPVIEWLTSSTDPAIVDPAVFYLKFGVWFFYALGPLFILRCSLQGMGCKIIPICSSILEMLVKIASAAILVPHLQYFGVVLTEPISWVLMTTLLAIGYVLNAPDKILNQRTV